MGFGQVVIGPPGSELCNALNPLWHHGLTGTPPSLMGVNTADQACQWVDDALCITEQRLRMKSLTLSKITSSVMITLPNSAKTLNTGLNLKFKAKSQKVLGHTRKGENLWEYSEAALNLIAKYKAIDQIKLITEKFLVNQNPENMLQAIIKNVPRNAILKPAHTIERLRGQKFLLDDSVTMVSDSGMVPISARGTVLSITDKMVEVVFDGPFIGRTSLNNC
ncbi:hypothetical protein PPACK8108_LOCUS6357 [Phakopsora pachyrhizi]|uniref:Uncharacterized protein n=1 Tax=Phakopsora pachyrhizi TaxID=170000 RepID=A0AAV0AUB1_PHAPC|nr:hypothetical protein PPACK8108_LOCUS6357 [Phakopsora pachyrhizi]